MHIRPATSADRDALWAILEPILRTGETYAMPRDWSREEALAYWFSPGHAVFVAQDDGAKEGGAVVGSYYLRANQKGGGDHVCNCGYMVAQDAGGRGVARAMCAHSLEYGAAQGFEAMQFNIVVSSNAPAVHLWQAMGFAIVGTLPNAFRHPRLGLVNAYVMHRTLQPVSLGASGT
jgi:ribosomal protein S18 acetylase RimI-like enzyme